MVEMHFVAAQGKHHLGVVEEHRRRLLGIGGLSHLEVHLSQAQPILCLRELGGVPRLLCRGRSSSARFTAAGAFVAAFS